MSRLRCGRIDVLAREITAAALHDAAAAELRRRPAGETIAVACSGGADSVALLLLLWAHFPERRGRWLVLHFNHRLRGRAAAGDAGFVRRLAQALGETSEVGRWERVPARVSEAEARAARWEFFSAAMRRNKARVIALGHNLDDVAETLLMRLTRGSGTAGLAAPRPVHRQNDGIIRVRPLLDCPARTIRTALGTAGVSWREDATNATEDFFRNRVRHRVLPALIAASRRDGLSGIAHARSLLEEDDAALEAWLDALAFQPTSDGPCDVRILRGKPTGLVRRALHRWAGVVGLAGTLTKPVVNKLLHAIAAGEEQQVHPGARRVVLLTSRGMLSLSAREPEARVVPVGLSAPWGELLAGGEVVGPRGDRLRMRQVRLSARRNAQIRAGGFSPAKTVFIDFDPGGCGSLHVRPWQPGDRYRPLGAPGRKKLQDLFVDRRVPRELRALWPVVVDGHGKVAWVPGFPPADELAIQPAAKLVVQLTYLPALPTVHRSKAHFFN